MSDSVQTEWRSSGHWRGPLLLTAIGVTLAVGCGGRTGMDLLLVESSGTGGSAATTGGSSSTGGSVSGGGKGGSKAGTGGAAGVAGDPGGGAAAGLGGSAGQGGSGGGEGGEPSVPYLWRMSREPFCGEPGGELNPSSVWSDERGVYLLVSNSAAVASIQFNGGQGWGERTSPQPSPLVPSLTGFVNGPLVEYGGTACAIQFIDEKQTVCSGASSQISSVFIVGDKLGYAVYADRLLRYDGKLWTQLGAPLPSAGGLNAQAVWASENRVAVATSAGIYLQESGGMMLQADPPDANYRAVWGFSADDVWAGNDSGQLVHFDGATWTTLAQVDGDCNGIRSLWGSDGALFYTTQRSVGTLQNGIATELLSYSCEETTEVTGMWGNSAKEVFFATQDKSGVDNDCGSIQLWWFDGKRVGAL